MNKLVLAGQLVIKDGRTFISYCTPSRKNLLPISVMNDEFKDGDWVRLEGDLQVKFTERKKHHYGAGFLFPSDVGVYENVLVIDPGVIVKLDSARTTPLTFRKIVDLVVADGYGNNLNCIAFGGRVDRLLNMRIGQNIHISKSLFLSRDYVKDGEVRTAYEVCIRDFEEA